MSESRRGDWRCLFTFFSTIHVLVVFLGSSSPALESYSSESLSTATHMAALEYKIETGQNWFLIWSPGNAQDRGAGSRKFSKKEKAGQNDTLDVGCCPLRFQVLIDPD